MKKISPLRFLPCLAAVSLCAGSAQAQAAFGSVQVGSAKIAYRVQGHGPALMLVHGFPLSGELFAKNRAASAAARPRIQKAALRFT